jgi:hypothetical protein
LVAGLLALLSVDPASALTNIQEVKWLLDRVGSSAVGGVRFQADITAEDLMPGIGVRFTIADRTAGSSSHPMLEYLIDPTALPAVGTPVILTALFALGCVDPGTVQPYPDKWFMTWCDGETIQQVRQGVNVGRGAISPVASASPYELIVEDERGVEGDPPSQPDPLLCGQTTAPAGRIPRGGHILDRLSGLPGAEELSSPKYTALRDAWGAQTEPLEGGSLELSFEPLSISCEGPAEANVPFRLYVIGRLDGATRCGVAGGEFRIVGIPPEWIAAAQPVPNTVTLGNPLQEGVTFGTPCAWRPNGLVTLYELLLIPSSEDPDRVIQVTRHLYPRNPHFACPVMCSCDYPVCNMYCVDSGFAVLNPRSLNCRTSIVSNSWTGIKQLYRE